MLSATEFQFWNRIRPNLATGCWEWTGPSSREYGHHNGEGAYRYSYRLLVGPIPDGLHIDHLCRNTLCVNPAHLEAVTREVNDLRRRGDIDHGTYRGFNAHKRRSEHPCQPCRDASNEYHRNWKRSKKNTTKKELQRG